LTFTELLSAVIEDLKKIDVNDFETRKKLQAPLMMLRARLHGNVGKPEWYNNLIYSIERRINSLGTDADIPELTIAQPCKFADVQKELFHPARPCKGRLVICQHPEAPQNENGDPWRWYESGCNPQKCKLYEAVKC